VLSVRSLAARSRVSPPLNLKNLCDCSVNALTWINDPCRGPGQFSRRAPWPVSRHVRSWVLNRHRTRRPKPTFLTLIGPERLSISGAITAVPIRPLRSQKIGLPQRQGRGIPHEPVAWEPDAYQAFLAHILQENAKVDRFVAPSPFETIQRHLQHLSMLRISLASHSHRSGIGPSRKSTMHSQRTRRI
jgi:hypothetical protein